MPPPPPPPPLPPLPLVLLSFLISMFIIMTSIVSRGGVLAAARGAVVLAEGVQLPSPVARGAAPRAPRVTTPS